MADVIRMSGVNLSSRERNSVARTTQGEGLATESGRGKGPATKSSSRSGSRSDCAEVPIVDDNTAVHKVLETRRGTGTGVQTDSVESLAKCKRVKFDLKEYGEGPNSRGGEAEADVSADTSRRSSEVLRRENLSGGSPSDTMTIPSRIVMRSNGDPPGADSSRHARSNSLLSSQRTEAAPASIRGSGASSGNGTEIFVSHKWGALRTSDR